MALQVFLINLDRSGDRLARCEPILDKLGLPWERVPAVEGKLLDPAYLKQINPHPAPHGEWFRPLTPGEIGCFLSHLRCWQLIVERGLDCALILEDDFNVHEDCTRERLQTLAASAQGPHAWDVLKLTCLRRNPRRVSSLPGGVELMGSGGTVPEDASAYMVSRTGAARLIQRRDHLLRPVDYDIKHYWERGLRVMYAKPILFWQISHAEAPSVIGDRAAYRRYPFLAKTQVYLRKHRYQLRFWLAHRLGLGRRRLLG